MPVPVELLRFFDRLAPEPHDTGTAHAETHRLAPRPTAPVIAVTPASLLTEDLQPIS